LNEGVQNRLAADPDFLFKLFVECGVDQVITTITNLMAFGLNPFLWSPANLATATLLHSVAALNDVALVRAHACPSLRLIV
jgi:hypothetical protein